MAILLFVFFRFLRTGGGGEGAGESKVGGLGSAMVGGGGGEG